MVRSECSLWLSKRGQPQTLEEDILPASGINALPLFLPMMLIIVLGVAKSVSPIQTRPYKKSNMPLSSLLVSSLEGVGD